MTSVEAVPSWPSEDCHLTSEYEEFVQRLYETAYVEAEARLDAEGQAGAHQASLEAQGMVRSEDGLKLVGVGAGRLTIAGNVLTSDDYVLKVAKYSPTSKKGFLADGRSQNGMEAETWTELPTTLREWFAPVTTVHDEFHWLIQPRVDTETPLPLGDETVDYLERVLQTEGWLPIELNATNLGMRDGGVTIYDYGLPIRPVSWLEQRMR